MFIFVLVCAFRTERSASAARDSACNCSHTSAALPSLPPSYLSLYLHWPSFSLSSSYFQLVFLFLLNIPPRLPELSTPPSILSSFLFLWVDSYPISINQGLSFSPWWMWDFFLRPLFLLQPLHKPVWRQSLLIQHWGNTLARSATESWLKGKCD